VSTAPGDVLALEPHEQMALAETAEAEFMHAFEAGAPPEAQEALGMAQHRIAGGVALVMAADPTGGYWNKALGFGVTEPFTGEVAAEVLEAYRAGGSRVAVLQLAPGALPEDWADVCARWGIVASSVWVKLLRPAGLDAAPAATDLEVGEAGPEHADAWSRVFAAGFGMPQDPSLLAMFGAVTTPGTGFHPMAAWDGERLVAGANLHVAGPAAAFCGAATLTEARGRGAQSVFMQRRVELARSLGADWCSAETWREQPGHEDADFHHNPSLHNMRRAGFVDVYERTNWVWRADA
jgi:hypothetical protein